MYLEVSPATGLEPAQRSSSREALQPFAGNESSLIKESVDENVKLSRGVPEKFADEGEGRYNGEKQKTGISVPNKGDRARSFLTV